MSFSTGDTSLRDFYIMTLLNSTSIVLGFLVEICNLLGLLLFFGKNSAQKMYHEWYYQDYLSDRPKSHIHNILCSIYRVALSFGLSWKLLKLQQVLGLKIVTLPIGLGMSYYVNFLGDLGSNGFHIKWHPWQLKKSKSWGPFWSSQLNSTANSAHLAHFCGKWTGLAVLSI